jgi:anaerobic selenocysteine-containing dehydrogenase
MGGPLPRDGEVHGACPQDCPDTCAMIYTVRDGRLVDVRGRADHPYTQGRLCVKLKHFAAHHYHPDRVLYPLRRTGAKGEGKFERIGWDTALEQIRTRWSTIIAEHGPAAILPHSFAGNQGLLNGLACGDAFFNRLGASIPEKTYCGASSATAFAMTYGPCSSLDPEAFSAARFIVLWGINTISTNPHHWPFILDARRKGARVVVIDPVATRTAKQADWHVRCRPGTDAALALALMHVLVSEGLVDTAWVREHTVGYEELAQRARDCPPEWAEPITGVPAADIRRLGHDLATVQPCAIRIGVGLERHRGGGQTIRAVACLAALTGSWRHPGGGACLVSIWNFPIRWDRVHRADLARPGTRVLNMLKLGQHLTSATLDPPIKSFFCFNSNPVIAGPEQNLLLRGLAREDLFTVVSELFITDTARYADIVLPATMQAEQFDLMYSWGQNYLTLNLPAIAAPGEAVPNVELFRRLARAMGMDDAPWLRDDEALLHDWIDWDHPHLRGITLAGLKTQGWARLAIGAPGTTAPHAQGGFPTRGGKVELKSGGLEQMGNFVADFFRSGSMEHQPVNRNDPVPCYVPPYESVDSSPELAAEFPLALITPKTHAFLNSQYTNESWTAKQQGEQFVMIHPDDAAARGIAGGADVRVFNRRGEVRARAVVTGDIMRGVVCVPVGYWRNGRPGTANSLCHDRLVEMGNGPAVNDNLVQVAVAT